jgi:hypothetical protein
MAHAIAVPNLVAVLLSYAIEGEHWIEVACGFDYEAMRAACPQALAFEGRTYARTGWNSDRGVAYYSTRAARSLACAV